VGDASLLLVRQVRFGTGFIRVRHLREAAQVETGTKGTAFAGKHHGAHRRLCLQRIRGVEERLEHGSVKGIHFVGPVQANVGDPVFDGNTDAI